MCCIVGNFQGQKLIVLAKCFHGRDDCRQFFFLEISSNTVLDFFISIVVYYLEIFHSQNHLLLSRVPLQLLVNRCVGKVVIFTDCSLVTKVFVTRADR